MKWLGAALELPPLRSRPSHALRWDGRDTFAFDCLFPLPGLRVATNTNLARGFSRESSMALCFTGAVCLNPFQYGTYLADGKWRGVLALASGPPKDGQPPQGLRPGG